MALKTRCSTPGAIYSTTITDSTIEVKVDLARTFNLSEDEAKQLERNLHNAVELALAPLFARYPFAGLPGDEEIIAGLMNRVNEEAFRVLDLEAELGR